MIPMIRPKALPASSGKTSTELDNAEEDQDPAKGVEVGEDEPRVVHEYVRVVQGADAVDDVERAHKQQQRCCEHDSASTSRISVSP